MPDYCTAVTFTAPSSLVARLETERERQGMTNRSEFYRLALQAYVAQCEINAAANDGILAT